MLKGTLRLIIFWFIIFFVSCGDCNQTNEDADEWIVTNKNIDKENFNFTIILRIMVIQNDSFTLFYSGEESQFEFSPKLSITKEVNGGKHIQDVIFNIPKGVEPNRIRLDFGVNYSQDLMYFESLSVCYSNRCHKMNMEEFSQVFKPNKHLSLNAETQIISTFPIDGWYDPNMSSINLKKLIQELKQM